MSYQREKRIDSNREPVKFWFWSLVVVFSFCLFSYGYLVRGAIVNIVARQNMESEILALNSNVIKLESEYIKLKNSITLELAQNMGFVNVSAQKFVTKAVKSPGLSVLTAGN